MISQLTEGETEFFEKLKPNHYARRIRSHFAAYSIKYDFARFYVLRRGEQAVTLISIFNAAMMCADITGQSLTAAEVEELAHFILMNSPYSVELDPRYAETLRGLIGKNYSSELRTEFAYSARGELPALDVNECPPLDDVYAILKESFPALADCYELWLTDTSHRVRRGLSQSFMMGGCTTATIQYIIDKTALIGHVATLPEYRGHYYARRLLYWIGERLTNDGYDVRLLARPHRVSYYREIGFAAVSQDEVFELRNNT